MEAGEKLAAFIFKKLLEKQKNELSIHKLNLLVRRL